MLSLKRCSLYYIGDKKTTDYDMYCLFQAHSVVKHSSEKTEYVKPSGRPSDQSGVRKVKDDVTNENQSTSEEIGQLVPGPSSVSDETTSPRENEGSSGQASSALSLNSALTDPVLNPPVFNPHFDLSAGTIHGAFFPPHYGGPVYPPH